MRPPLPPSLPVVRKDRPAIADRLAFSRWRPRARRIAIGGLVALALTAIGAGLLIWTPFDRPDRPALGRHRIAVLPLANRSPDPSDEYFADGMTEELISTLSRIPGLEVTARTSIMQYKGKETSVADVGRQLNVGSVLEGSVRKAGTKVRATATLIDVATQAHLWSEDYEGELAAIFAIQAKIAQRVTRALNGQPVAAGKPSGRTGPAPDTEAYTLYLKGRYYLNRETPESLKTSVEYFAQAIRRDPTSARAYSSLAGVHLLYGLRNVLPPKQDFPEAEAAAARALEIDQDLPDAHATLAAVKLLYEFDWPGAERGFRRALVLDRGNVRTLLWYALFLRAMGRFDEAIAAATRARELDPLSVRASAAVGWTLLFARRYDEALDEFRKTLASDPNFFDARSGLGWTLLMKRMLEQAVSEMEKAVALSGGDAGLTGDLGYALGIAGRRVEARSILEKLERRSMEEYVPAYAMAEVSVALERYTGAFEWLDRAYAERSNYLWQARVDPAWDRLRGDPRFTALLKKLHLPQ